jgi:hypothetical protein
MLTKFESVHVNRKYNFGETASDAGVILKPLYKNKVRDGECINVPFIWYSVAL